MTSRTLVLVIGAVVIFAGSAWGGYAVHKNIVGKKVLDAPGWCCVVQQEACVVAQSNDDCRGKGGSVFNRDAAACADLCGRTVNTRSRSRSRARASAAANVSPQ